MYTSVKILIIYSLTVIKIVNLQKFEGGSCVLPNGIQGKCIIIHECPDALENLKRGEKPEACGFSRSEPIVCCANKLLTKSESQRVCESYREDLIIQQPPSIVGGEDAVSTEYPHSVALGFGSKDNIEWNCGGSLISPRFVLTAAHCLHDTAKGNVKYVRMGHVDLESNSEEIQNFEVLRRIKHPDYKPPIAYNDIALIELNQSAVFSHFVQPACLYNKPLNNQLPLTATGWGLTQYAGDRAKILQKVNLQLFNHTECAALYKTTSKRRLPVGISEDKQICAGSEEEKDTCQGDSGGPLQTYDHDVFLYRIIGVTSFGKKCGTSGVPAVYTRVFYYIPWIESIVWSK